MLKYKLLLVLCVLVLLGCSSTPSESDMKGIVASIIDQSIVRQFSGVRFVDIEFKEFKILNSFNKKINGENWYCAKIHTVYTGRALNPYTGQKNPRQTMTDTEQFRFQKQGNEWYGRKGW